MQGVIWKDFIVKILSDGRLESLDMCFCSNHLCGIPCFHGCSYVHVPIPALPELKDFVDYSHFQYEISTPRTNRAAFTVLFAWWIYVIQGRAFMPTIGKDSKIIDKSLIKVETFQGPHGMEKLGLRFLKGTKRRGEMRDDDYVRFRTCIRLA